MNTHIVSLLVLFAIAIAFTEVTEADINIEQPTSLQDVHDVEEISQGAAVSREKRTLLLKKKLLGVGALGLGLGVGLGAIKGYVKSKLY